MVGVERDSKENELGTFGDMMDDRVNDNEKSLLD